MALWNALQLAATSWFGSGVANMVFIIPSQTMFQERTPPEIENRRFQLLR